MSKIFTEFCDTLKKLENMNGVSAIYASPEKEIKHGNGIFQAGSNSKFVAVIVFLIALEKAKISFDEKIANCMPIKIHPDTTIKHLFSHTAGINAEHFNGYTEKPNLSMLDIIARDIRFDLPFGVYKYSGGGFCLAQYYIENITKKAFRDLANDLLFLPLGLQESTYYFLNTGNGNFQPESMAAGLWTTPSEYLKVIQEFLLALAGESDIISINVAKAIIESQTVDYGLALGVLGNGVYEHSGSNYNYKSKFMFDVKSKEIFVIMVNDEMAYDILCV